MEDEAVVGGGDAAVADLEGVGEVLEPRELF